METLFAAAFTVMIAILYRAFQQRQNFPCQQEVHITKRSARRR